MADKRISDLPQAEVVDNTSKIPVERNGTAQHITGAQLAKFAIDSANQAAQGSVGEAKTAAAEAKLQAQNSANSASASENSAKRSETYAKASQDAADSVQDVSNQVAAAQQASADAQAAKTAAEQARDEAQAIAGGDFLTLSGGTMRGPITLAGDPTEDLHAVPKQYLDSAIGYVEAELVEVNGGSSEADDDPGSGGSGGVSYVIGHGLKVKDGVLMVNSVNNFEGDNSLPATASLVQSTVGNIEILLSTI